ncbi:MAG: methyltransferase domain-containing protein [Actinomycetota bacterium]|nr:methyltransferase domain-containing protein [Actinomycetota bacterium]
MPDDMRDGTRSAAGEHAGHAANGESAGQGGPGGGGSGDGSGRSDGHGAPARDTSETTHASEKAHASEPRADGPAAFWDSLYSERGRMWSGEPNRALVETAGHLVPGRALDLGCGEGADSVWLALQGWTVTAVDVSAVAIARAAAHAAERAVPEGQITWLHADLSSWLPSGQADLVSACFLHSPIDFPRAAVLRAAAGAVASGGHLLVVSHAEPPPWAAGHDHHEHRFPIPEDDLVDLALDAAWSVLVNEVREREATGPDGQQATLRDVVTLVRRH